MLIGVISDIHGNLNALDSVLSEFSRKNVDRIVCLGDAAATGPRPHEVLRRLRSMDVPIVIGNRDEYLLNVRYVSAPPTQANDYSRRVAEIDKWCGTKLTNDDFEYIKSFPKTLRLSVAENRDDILFCFHGSPKSNTDLITSTTSDEELELKLGGQSACLMAGGHSHQQMFRRVGERVIINPGSVGQAIEKPNNMANTRRVPWAEFALIQCSEEGTLLNAELSRKYLMASEVLSDAISSGMPYAEWWAVR